MTDTLIGTPPPASYHVAYTGSDRRQSGDFASQADAEQLAQGLARTSGQPTRVMRRTDTVACVARFERDGTRSYDGAAAG